MKKKWNPATCSCKYGKYLASIMDDSAIKCDEIIDAEAKSNNEKQKPLQQILMKKYITCKTQKFHILLAFLIITIAMLMAVSIYYYLIKYRANQKHLLSLFQLERVNQWFISNKL